MNLFQEVIVASRPPTYFERFANWCVLYAVHIFTSRLMVDTQTFFKVGSFTHRVQLAFLLNPFYTDRATIAGTR
jgi:hypothetical protein